MACICSGDICIDMDFLFAEVGEKCSCFSGSNVGGCGGCPFIAGDPWLIKPKADAAGVGEAKGSMLVWLTPVSVKLAVAELAMSVPVALTPN